MQTGVVFDINEFSVFDGPGIRTTVFLKGCPLRCQWCHNPEGLSAQPQLLDTAAAYGHARQDHQRIAGEKWTSQDLAKRLYKDLDIFLQSCGGITFSGGEPLSQWPFISEVIDLMPGIHTAIETSGYASDSVFANMLRKVDLVMMDLKMMNAERHKYFTGVDNSLILKHARSLCDGDTPFVIRIPLIPGVNDNKENFEQTAIFIEGAANLLQVELLPYHKTAGAKYKMAGMEYRPEFDEDRLPIVYLEPFENRNIKVLVM